MRIALHILLIVYIGMKRNINVLSYPAYQLNFVVKRAKKDILKLIY